MFRQGLVAILVIAILPGIAICFEHPFLSSDPWTVSDVETTRFSQTRFNKR